ncbi:MAG: DNA gyrase subunit A [Chloroflexi bacterium]|jgi:DNA gyrase subunit A|nr:MAG: DNA gyrase subunit A [Chloroflexota bacterium]
MTTDSVKPVRIVDEMRTSYLDYAMSVIVSRALPDVRDGLKPVQRRILYSMDELAMRPGTAYKKSARLVGEVMGKYHPHGDSPIYEAMVRMAQNFSVRYPLVDGQGNFGSVDNDPPAAMRYTEARLSPIAQELLADIDQDTVDFSPNFDGSLNEPKILPARLPNLIVNGSTGIAVGMTTNIPPHNLSEICDAVLTLIKNPNATPEDLIEIVPGPDFPTGATILGQQGIREAYQTGKGRAVVRAKMEAEEMERAGRYRLVVTELPYQVSKAGLLQKIVILAKDRKIEGISEVRDESDRRGMRMVIELRRDAQVQRVMNNLYKHTALQSVFHINMLALVNGQPQTLSLPSILQEFIDHRTDITRRKSEYEMRRAQVRIHILEGLRKAIDDLDAAIQLIRNADDAESARISLMEKYDLDEEQAQAILEMQLRRLAALERKRIEDEHEQLTKRVSQLMTLLADPNMVLAVVAEETKKLKDKFGDERRTEVSLTEITDFSNEDLIPHQEVVVTLSERGYIKCVPAETYRRQHRGGKGVRGQTTREGDVIRHHLVADTHDFLLFFTNNGRVYKKKVYELPLDNSRVSRGTPLVQALDIRPEESVQTILDVSSMVSGEDILFSTKLGEIKRMALSSLANIRSNGIRTIDLEEGDELVSVRLCSAEDDVIMVSKNGMSIRFPAIQVRRSSRVAGGVRGMRLKENDLVVAMDVVQADCQLLVISQNGFGKPSAMDRYRLQSRGGSGLGTFRITSKSGPVATARVVREGEDIMIISKRGQVTRSNLSELRELSRRTQGVSIVSLPENDEVVSITSMDPKSRHARDTKPRAASGRDVSQFDDMEPISNNGHDQLSENGHFAEENEN